jgi:hypothetical protein
MVSGGNSQVMEFKLVRHFCRVPIRRGKAQIYHWIKFNFSHVFSHFNAPNTIICLITFSLSLAHHQLWHNAKIVVRTYAPQHLHGSSVTYKKVLQLTGSCVTRFSQLCQTTAIIISWTDQLHFSNSQSCHS